MARNDASIPKLTEKLVYQQANSRCPFCGCDEIPLLDIHHIVPRARGGPNEPSNLILSCKNCHARIHNGVISQEEVRRVKKSLGAVIYRMPGVPEPSQSSNTVSVGGDANGSIVAGQVIIHGDAKLPSKMNHPAGSIGADLLRKNYIQYLVRRYDEFRQVGQRSYGQKGAHQYGAIHNNIQGKFKAKTYFIPIGRFEELVAYIHGRIDKTIQAKRNRAQGHRAYSSFEDYAREQQGR
jgi:hypothetical protein